ncbi:hypothetical protein Mapa_008700 [Marchantia paleacea]|nr:hypothetical protein Mapa_008700 [Marchantia paleacea]
MIRTAIRREREQRDGSKSWIGMSRCGAGKMCQEAQDTAAPRNLVPDSSAVGRPFQTRLARNSLRWCHGRQSKAAAADKTLLYSIFIPHVSNTPSGCSRWHAPRIHVLPPRAPGAAFVFPLSSHRNRQVGLLARFLYIITSSNVPTWLSVRSSLSCGPRVLDTRTLVSCSCCCSRRFSARGIVHKHICSGLRAQLGQQRIMFPVEDSS